jgi:hypothetical protein
MIDLTLECEPEWEVEPEEELVLLTEAVDGGMFLLVEACF